MSDGVIRELQGSWTCNSNRDEYFGEKCSCHPFRFIPYTLPLEGPNDETIFDPDVKRKMKHQNCVPKDKRNSMPRTVRTELSFLWEFYMN